MHSSNSRRICVASLLFFFGLIIQQLPKQVVAQTIVEKIEGHADTSSWALHESGRIFAAVKSTDSVIEYDLNGKEVRKFSVGAEPTEMMIKGNHLIVACQKTSSFSVIDLKANKPVGKIKLQGKGPYGLFCSKADNGLFYGICNTGNAWWDGEIFQADLATMKVRKRVSVRGWGQSHPVHVAMSSDGKWIVPDARGASSPSGADLMSVNEEACTFSQVRDHHSTFGQIKAGPANRYWTLGNKLYPLNIKAKARTFTGSPVAINPQFDLVASVTPTKLNIERFSDAKLIKSVPIELLGETDMKALKRSKAFSKVQLLLDFDSSGSHAIVANKDRCLIVDLNELNIPLKPLLMINVATKVNLRVGEEIKVPLRLSNEKLNPDVKYELKKGPTGAQIAGNELVWKATAKDIGPHPIQILAKTKNGSDEVTIELDVAGPKLELDFAITSMNVERSGKYAVVWGQKIVKDRNGRVVSGRNGTGTSEIAVVDLQTQKVVTQKPFAAGVLTAMMQYPYVMVASRSSNIVYRYDAETLTDSKRMFLKQTCKSIVAMPKNQVGVVTGDHNFLVNVVDPETMKSTQKSQVPYNHFRSQRQVSFPEVAPGIVDFNSQLLNMDDGTAVMFESNPGLQALVSIKNRRGMPFEMRELSGKVFGRFISQNRIVSSTGSTISQFQNRQLFSSPYHPVAFAIRTESKNLNSRNATKSYLETISLVDGEILDSRVFDVSDRSSRSNNYGYAKTSFAFKDKIVYFRENKLFVIPLDSSLDDAPTPLYFPIRKLAPLTVDQPQTISFKAKGGKGKLTYQLISEYPGIKIDADTGVVTVDTPSLFKKSLNRSSSNYSIRRSNSGSNQTPPSEEQMMKWFGESSKGKTAYVVPINLAVTDEEAQEDRMSVNAVVFASKKELAAINAKKRFSRSMNQTLRSAENVVESALEAIVKSTQQPKPRVTQPRVSRPRVGEAMNLNPKKNNLDARAEKIEDRLGRIENALDSVLKKLEKLDDKK